jgi:hypothetical protein
MDLAKNEAKTRFLEQLREITQEEFQGFWKVFTPLEQTIIKTLYFSSSALAVKEIRSKIMAIMEYEIVNYVDPKIAEKEKPKPYFKISPIYFTDKNTIKKELQKLAKIMDLQEIHKKDYYRYQELVEDFLRNVGNKPPSFGTIQNALKNLMDMGFVISRPAEKTKAKAYYTLNPKLTGLITKTKYYEHWE